MDGIMTRAIEQADEMVVITDPHGAIVYVNPAFERVTGYSRAEAVGRNPRFLKSGVQNDEFYRALWATIGSGKTWRGRLINKKKSGSFYSQDTTISRVLDVDGNVTSYVSVNRDVSAVLALEGQYLQAQKMEAVGRLAGGVAHDFNNVLSVILSYADLISGDLKPDDSLRADIDEIRRAGRRAAELTRQLLAFSRRQVLAMKVVNLNDSVGGMAKLITRLLGAGVELTLLAGELWNVKADPGQVEQILMNLAVNARDAMPHGGRLTIETTNVHLDEDYAGTHQGVCAGDYVQIAVTDTGSGMEQGNTGTRVRAIFHYEGDRPWHGPGARYRLRDRSAKWRSRLGLQRTGSWDDVQSLFPTLWRRGRRTTAVVGTDCTRASVWQRDGPARRG